MKIKVELIKEHSTTCRVNNKTWENEDMWFLRNDYSDIVVVCNDSNCPALVKFLDYTDLNTLLSDLIKDNMTER